VSGRSPSKVETRAAVSSSGSIMRVFSHKDRNLPSEVARFKGNCVSNSLPGR
jgi:hypothetical protein